MKVNCFKNNIKVRNYRGHGQITVRIKVMVRGLGKSHVECQWSNFALVTMICQDLYNFLLLPCFWSNCAMSKFEFSYVYPKYFWMQFSSFNYVQVKS